MNGPEKNEDTDWTSVPDSSWVTLLAVWVLGVVAIGSFLINVAQQLEALK